MLGIGRLERVEKIVVREMLSETVFDYSFREFRQEREMRYRPIVG